MHTCRETFCIATYQHVMSTVVASDRADVNRGVGCQIALLAHQVSKSRGLGEDLKDSDYIGAEHRV